ncbi:hypothetical protein [Methylophaga thalassica]|uniref:hypothetical protein n=1 Tax=Methylophaga aminisulfidivorans TaxID=230105 RepID=UPI003A90FBA9
MEDIIRWISLVSNGLTIVASGIAIYVFFTKRESIATIFSLLLNYTYQLSLSEMKEKLEKLNEYNAKDPDENEKIVNILNEVCGQIKGNERLSENFKEIVEEINTFALGRRKLTEPKKRALVSELRERIRHLNIRNIDDLVGDTK